VPTDDLVPGLLIASDVLGTGWFGAIAAQAATAIPSPSGTAPSAYSPSLPPDSSALTGSSR